MQKILTFCLVVTVSLGIAGLASAQKYGLDKTAGAAKYDTSGKTDVYSMVNLGVTAVLGALAIVFFVLITYAGFQWMTARGNEEIAAKSKTMIQQAVIGLVVVMAAYATTTFIFKALNA